MSFDISFDFRFDRERPITYVELVGRFLSAGWTADNGGGAIQYYEYKEDDAGSIVDLEGFVVGVEKLDMILNHLSELEAAGRPFSICLRWGESKSNGVSIYVNTVKGQGDVLVVSSHMNRVCLRAAPPWTDHNWYLERLIPTIEAAGCRIGSLKSAEVP